MTIAHAETKFSLVNVLSDFNQYCKRTKPNSLTPQFNVLKIPFDASVFFPR